MPDIEDFQVGDIVRVINVNGMIEDALDYLGFHYIIVEIDKNAEWPIDADPIDNPDGVDCSFYPSELELVHRYEESHDPSV